jgi:hypothetical protein
VIVDLAMGEAIGLWAREVTRGCAVSGAGLTKVFGGAFLGGAASDFIFARACWAA